MQQSGRQRALGPKQRTALALAAYTLGFAAVALAHAWPYLADGRYFIYGADAYTQMFPVFCYTLNYIKQCLGILLSGSLRIPLYDFSLGLGGDILATLNWHGLGNPFYLLALGARTERLPLAFSLITVLQLYLGGIGFYAFCRKLAGPAEERAGAVVGAWLYVFTGFYPLAVEHPIMAHAVFYLPLLLLGCEKLLRRESPLLLALSVFFMALTGFYFLFICSVALAFYVLLRVWAMGQKPWWKAALFGAVRSLAAYLTGLCMAAPVFLPGVRGYLSSARTGGAGAVSLGSFFSGFGTLRGWFAGLADPVNFWCAGAFGLLAVVLCLFAPRKRRSWPLIAGVGISMVFVVSPLAQNALVGFGSTADTRFWFALQFLWAFAAVRCWPWLTALSRRQLCALAGAAVLYALFCRRGSWLGFLLALLALLAVCQQRLWGHSPRALMRTKQLAGAALAALVLLQPALALSADSARRAPAYRNERFARQMPPVTAETLPEGEYRVDTGDVGLHRWWASANAPLVGGYKGLSVYFSILDRHYAGAMLDDWALAPAQQGGFSFQGLDGCMALNTLASVRYSFVRPGEEDYVPYGYAYVGETPQAPVFTFQPDNGPTLLRYENLYALPLGYTYSSALSAEQYAALNGLQKQAAILSAAALADGEVPAGFAAEPELAGVGVLPYALEADGAAWQDGLMIAAEGEESTLTLRFALEEPGEVHLRLAGFAVQSAPTASHLEFSLDGGLGRQLYPYAVNETECWVNIGQADAGQHTAVITLAPGSRFALEGLEVWSYSCAAYEAAAAARGETVLQNITVGRNSLAGLLQTDTDTLLCLSVPYSSGWHATIDGARCEPRRANSMFMVLEVPAGEHVIGLYYITPGLKTGLMLCALGLLAFVLQLLWHHRAGLPFLAARTRARPRPAGD